MEAQLVERNLHHCFRFGSGWNRRRVLGRLSRLAGRKPRERL